VRPSLRPHPAVGRPRRAGSPDPCVVGSIGAQPSPAMGGESRARLCGAPANRMMAP
jgi:hypothetical protein